MTYILQNVLIPKQNNYFHLFTNKSRCILLYPKMFKSKFLNVAEKNDAAKNIAQYLSRGTARRREGFSKYNKIYEFEAEFMHQKCLMVMTSVSGHLLEYKFPPEFQWKTYCDPITLFDAEVIKDCPDDKKNIKRTLENEVKTCNGLIIWTDCDREGENIGFEIIDVCKKIKPNLQIYRAKFSEITAVSVTRALHNLEQPNKNVSDAVDVRQELDLRIGASFTRFQTMRLQNVFPSALDRRIVSYGSCQIPTLGFVVERYNAIDNFIEEPFWKIKVNHTLNNLSVDFVWDRVRLFDQDACQIFHNMCLENRQAKVMNVITKPKSKFRPLPLDTIQLEKLASTKLKINAKETMKIAEKLYTSGFISYPRTETTEFPKEINLGQLVSLQTSDPQWGPFAARVLADGPSPRKGTKNDGAHPPIHPTKYADNLADNEKRVYELIVRSFLACCSKNAEGQETTVTIEVANEKFSANGLMIIARNYLEVYPYDKWSSKEIHVYQSGQIFDPTSIDMVEGKTSPPNLLTEADLIALMEKHGIGTDATHAEHIETIKSRQYVALEGAHFVPGVLGMGLVRGYQRMRLQLARPELRAGLEAALRAVCDGSKRPADVLREQIAIYKNKYMKLQAEAEELDSALAQTLNVTPAAYTPTANNTFRSSTPVTKCPMCGSDMYLRRKKSNENEFYIGCVSYPQCKKAFWLNSIVKNIEVLPDSCTGCGPNNKNLKFEWSNNSISHLYPPPYIGCIGGCDTTLNDVLGVHRTSGNPHTNPSTNPPSSPPMNPRTNPPMNSRTNNPPYIRANSYTNERTNNQNITRNNSTDSSGFVSDASTGNSSRNATAPNVGNNTIMCKCGQPTAQYTSRKLNENAGRKFYKCQANACDFFQWGPPLDSLQNSNETPSSSSGDSVGRSFTDPYSTRAGEVECNCGWASVKKTVQKEGPNKGRLFYCCSKDNRRCNFFQWADETTNSGEQLANNRGRGRGRGSSGGGSGTRGARKCSACHQPGHFRNHCPNIT